MMPTGQMQTSAAGALCVTPFPPFLPLLLALAMAKIVFHGAHMGDLTEMVRAFWCRRRHCCIFGAPTVALR